MYVRKPGRPQLPRKAKTVLLIAIAGVIGAVLTIMFVPQSFAPITVRRPVVTTPRPPAPPPAPKGFIQLTATNSYFSDWSKDGRNILYYTIDADWKYSMWNLPVNSSETKPLYLGQGKNPKYSPNGKFIAFEVSRGDLWVMDSNGSSSSRSEILPSVVSTENSTKWYWQEDNTLYSEKYLGSNPLVSIVYNPLTQKQNTYRVGDPRGGYSGYSAISPDNNYAISSDGSTNFSLYKRSTNQRLNGENALYELTKDIQGSASIEKMVWSPDSRKVMVLLCSNDKLTNSACIYYLKLVTLSNHNPPLMAVTTVDISSVSRGNGTNPGTFVGAFSWSPDSKRFVISVSGQNPNTYITTERDRKDPRQFVPSYLKLVTVPDNSPSSASVRLLETAVPSADARIGASDFGAVTWSSDGKWLAYQRIQKSSREDGKLSNSQMSLLNMETNYTYRTEVPFSGAGGIMQFSPDNRSIVASKVQNGSNPDQPSQLWVYYLEVRK